MNRPTVKVLDYGHVTLIDHFGTDLSVCNAARVSFHKESKEFTDKDAKLIEFLAKNGHWTPFGHVQITLCIKTPIAIRAQLGKHQVGLCMNEVSRRYVSETPEIYLPKWRGKPTGGAKQGSSGFLDMSDPYLAECRDEYEASVKAASLLYDKMIERGIAPEQARFVLPQGAYTEWWWTGSLAAFARVYKQRIDPHAQHECQLIAKAIDELLRPLFPVSWKSLTGINTADAAT